MTKNEILTSFNKPEDFILAVVEFLDGDSHKLHYIWRPFIGRGVTTDFNGASVNFSIADLLAIYGHTLPQETLEQHMEVVRTLLEAYWEQPEEVRPQALLNGSDLMELFDLTPGPRIGELLESLWEAQAVGEVENKRQAVKFIRKQLKQ